MGGFLSDGLNLAKFESSMTVNRIYLAVISIRDDLPYPEKRMLPTDLPLPRKRLLTSRTDLYAIRYTMWARAENLSPSLSILM